MPFDQSTALDAIDVFCRTRNVTSHRVVVANQVDVAMNVAVGKGPDIRWRTIPFWSPDDDPGQSLFGVESTTVLDDHVSTIFERDAELCQATAFGISLTEWLAVEQEG